MQHLLIAGFKNGAQKGFQEGVSRGRAATEEALTQLAAKAAVKEKQ